MPRGRPLIVVEQVVRVVASNCRLAPLLAVMVFVSQGHASSSYLVSTLDTYLKAQAEKADFSGSVLVARGDEVLFSKGYGYADVEWKIPNTPQTRFRIASMTKSFVATAILMLREEGKLTLEDSICKYVDRCPPPWRAVRVHHLLSNSSGIPNYFWGTEPDNAVPQTREQILDRLRNKPLEFEPGTRFNYGNSAWYLLGVVMQEVTDKSYDQVLKEKIFDPLGMRDTGHDDREQILERRARGYSTTIDGELRNAPTEHISWVIAAASLYSTVSDLYKFERALTQGVLLPKKTVELMWTSLDLLWRGPGFTGKEKAGYGYGWWLLPKSEYNAQRIVRGTGGMAGFITSLMRYPDEDVTIVVIENCSGCGGTAIADIEALVFGRKPHGCAGNRF